MSRIKFRGLVINPLASGSKWITSDEEWHEVYLNHADRYAQINGHAVTYESVSQYTGKKDTNGKEIYEGDIVIHDFMNYAGYGNVEEESEKLVIEDLTNLPFDASSIGCEVIGNIYENPELIK